MASAVIHMCVAKRVNDKIIKRGIKLEWQPFALGSIAPDIAKQVGERKNKSHFLPPNAKEDTKPNLVQFLKKYGHTMYQPFSLGYYVHLVTDEYWFSEFIYLFINEYCKNRGLEKMLYADLKDIIYNDYTSMNIKLIKRYELDVSLFTDRNINYPTSEIYEVPMDKINIIVEKMGEIIRKSKSGKIELLEMYYIYDFIEDCTNKIIDRLEKMLYFQNYQ